MSSVDERIVEMRFDNKQFESGAKTSIATLDKLQSALKLGDSGQSLDNLGKSMQGLDTNGLASALSVVTNRFSALGIMGDQVLRRLTDGFISLGSKAMAAVKSLTIDQIGAGFAKYSSKTEAVQTIMNATGQSIDEVNTVLQRLNQYTDETSYSFSDMVSSIAKFTGAGQDLDKTEIAMEGIANWAATAGVGPEKAASAFYNLSQAISTGSLRMQDWKSLQNLNMSTKMFKETAIQTAIELGKLKKVEDSVGKTTKGVDVDFKSFDSTLSTGWLDTEVLMATLTKFADRSTEFGLAAFHAAQEAKTFKDAFEATKDAVSTSWMNTWELIFGNYEEAKVLWTNVANEMIDFFTRGAEARNEMLQEWHDTGGYTAALEALGDAWEGIKNIADVVGDVFHQVFPPMTAQRLINITNSVKGLATKFKDFTTVIKTNGLAEVPFAETGKKIDYVRESLGKIEFKSDIFKNLVDGFHGILSTVSLAGKGIKAFIESLSPVGNVLKNFGIKAVEVFGKFGRFMSKLNNSKDLTTRYSTVLTEFTKIQNTVIDAVGNLTSKFSSFGDVLKSVAAKVKDFIKNGLTKLKDSLSNIFQNFSLKDGLSIGAVIGGLFAGVEITKIIGKVKKIFDGLDSLKENISNILDSVGDAIGSFGDKIRAEALGKIAIAIALLAGSLLLLGSIKPEKLVSGLMAMAALFGELLGSMAILSKFLSVAGAKSINQVSKGMIKLAASMVLLAAALKIVSLIKPEQLTSALGATILMMAAMTGAMIALSKWGGKAKTSVLGMIGMAAAVLILASAVKSLSSIDSGFGQGLLGTIALLAALTAAGVAISKTGSAGKMLAAGIGMIGMAAALLILVPVVKKLSEMDLASLGKGLGAIGVLLAEFALFNNFGGGAGKMLAGAASLLIISAAIGALTLSIKALGGMELGSLAMGVGGIAAVLLALVVAMNAMNGALAGAAAMIIAAGAIMILTPAIVALGQLKIGQVGVALLALAGAFAVIGLAGYLLAPVVVPILALAGALLAISAAIAVAGVGFTLLAAGISAFAGSLAISVGAIVSAIGMLIVGLAEIATSLVEAVAAIIGAIAMGFATAVPTVVSAVLMLILGILNALGTYAPQIAAAGVRLIVGLINAIAASVGPLVDAGINLIVSFINGMANAIDEHGPDILSAIGNLLGSIIGFIAEAIAQLLELIPGIGERAAAAVRKGGEAINAALSGSDLSSAGAEMADSAVSGVESAAGEMNSAGEAIGQEAVVGLQSTAEDAETAGEDDAQAFLDGLSSLMGDANGAGLGLSTESLSGMTSSLSEFTGVGTDAGSGFIEGLKSMYPAASSAGAGLGAAALDGARAAIDSHSPSKEFMKLGRYSGEGYENGMESTFRGIYDISGQMGRTALQAMSDSLKSIADYISADEDFHPVITPVVDFTNIRAAGGQLSSYFGSTLPLNINGNPYATLDGERISELISISRGILRAVQNGHDIYFDDGEFAGRLNRRLGSLI